MRKESSDKVRLSGRWGWFKYDGEVYYGENLEMYGPSLHQFNGKSYAYEIHLRGVSVSNYHKVLILLMETDVEESHNEFLDALAFWENSIRWVALGDTRAINKQIDLTHSFGAGNIHWLEYTGSDFSEDCQPIDYLISATTIFISPQQAYAFGSTSYPTFERKDMNYDTQVFQNWQPVTSTSYQNQQTQQAPQTQPTNQQTPLNQNPNSYRYPIDGTPNFGSEQPKQQVRYHTQEEIDERERLKSVLENQINFEEPTQRRYAPFYAQPNSNSNSNSDRPWWEQSTQSTPNPSLIDSKPWWEQPQHTELPSTSPPNIPKSQEHFHSKPILNFEQQQMLHQDREVLHSHYENEFDNQPYDSAPRQATNTYETIYRRPSDNTNYDRTNGTVSKIGRQSKKESRDSKKGSSNPQTTQSQPSDPDSRHPGMHGDRLKALQEADKAAELTKKTVVCNQKPCPKVEVGRMRYCIEWKPSPMVNRHFRNGDSWKQEEREQQDCARWGEVPIYAQEVTSSQNAATNNQGLNPLSAKSNDLVESVQQLGTRSHTKTKAAEAYNLRKDCETKLEVVLNRYSDSSITDRITQACDNVKSLAQLNFHQISSVN